MKVKTKVLKRDPRLKAIQTDIQRLYEKELRVSCISDEEIRGYVEKYFLFEPIIEAETHERTADYKHCRD